MTTAVIHHTHVPVGDHHYLAVAIAVRDELVGVRTVALSEDVSTAGIVAEAFASLRSARNDESLALYISHATIAKLVGEMDTPGLVVRPVITGVAFTETWNVASSACAAAGENLWAAHEYARRRAASPTIIGTDASKNIRKRKSIAGTGFATNTGKVGFHHVEADNVLEAEFAALVAGVRAFEDDDHLILLTDSAKAVAIIDGTVPLCGGAWETRFAEWQERFATTGQVLEVRWVRGHNGHVLNEIADRAARCGRRAAEWDLTREQKIEYRARFRNELAEALAQNPELLPEADQTQLTAAA